VLTWRVAGAVPDAVVVVPGPIASTPFVEQAVQRSGGRHPDLQAKDPPVTMMPICTPICEAPHAIFRLRMSWFLTYMSALRFPILPMCIRPFTGRSETEHHDGRSPPHSGR
jgi:hypothetical protein